MKTFWDYSDEGRAALTADEVRALLDFQLMEKGVLKVAQPIAKELRPVPTMPTTTVFVVRALAFEKIEQAEAFLALNPRDVDYNWQDGDKYRYIQDLASHERAIERVQVYNKADLANVRVLMDENAATRKANEEAQASFEKASRAVDDVLDEVWDDWHRCQNLGAHHGRVVNTWNEYVKMAGDEQTAIKFLRRAFPIDQIKAAAEWFHVDIPVVDSIDNAQAVPEAVTEAPAVEAATSADTVF